MPVLAEVLLGSSAWHVWLPFLLPLPAVADFVTHRLGRWQGSNATRLSSGILLGVAVGLIGHNLFGSRAWWCVSQVAWLVFLEFAVAVVLSRAGKLDAYIERYEEAVRMKL